MSSSCVSLGLRLLSSGCTSTGIAGTYFATLALEKEGAFWRVTDIKADEELAVAYADEPLEIGFNAKYLQEIAQQVDRENAVFLFNGSGDAALIREGGDTSAVYVVMPMRM